MDAGPTIFRNSFGRAKLQEMNCASGPFTRYNSCRREGNNFMRKIDQALPMSSGGMFGQCNFASYIIEAK